MSKGRSLVSLALIYALRPQLIGDLLTAIATGEDIFEITLTRGEGQKRQTVSDPVDGEPEEPGVIETRGRAGHGPEGC